MKKRTRRRLHAVRRERRAHRNYKDSSFRKLFSEKTKAIELYNALSGASYDETVPFEFWTLDNVFVDGQVNDLCCSIDGNLAVFLEAQSTICGCIAHRMLGYVSRSLDRYLAQVDIYGEKAREIPAISFYELRQSTTFISVRWAWVNAALLLLLILNVFFYHCQAVFTYRCNEVAV